MKNKVVMNKKLLNKKILFLKKNIITYLLKTNQSLEELGLERLLKFQNKKLV
jgi:hypothetical protein